MRLRAEKAKPPHLRNTPLRMTARPLPPGGIGELPGVQATRVEGRCRRVLGTGNPSSRGAFARSARCREKVKGRCGSFGGGFSSSSWFVRTGWMRFEQCRIGVAL